MKRYLLLFFVFINMFHVYSISNLTDLQSYANKHPEYPKSDNENWIDPDYTSFHKSLTPNIFLRFTHALGIKKHSTWSSAEFKTLLKKVGDYRISQKFSGRLAAHITVQPESKFFIWGDVHGAFHSLVRCLTELHEQKIITTDLKIINSNHYFVFNGDYINRSPYTLETLLIALLLTKQNPDQIFYIRGKHEDKNYWHNFGLKRELLLRARSVSDELIPLNSLISKYFKTLPVALFISTPEKQNNVIQISHQNRATFDVDMLGDLFSNNSNKNIHYYNIKKKQKSPIKVDVKAIVKTENWMENRLTQKGLSMPEQDIGTTSWTVLSSPIKVHQTFSNFFYDAFAIIDIAQPIEESTISLYHQNVKELDGFTTYATYNIVTGINSESPLFHKTKKPPFTIGSSMALVRGIPIMGQQLKRGMSIRINQKNKNGGIDGRHIRAVVYNDDYTPNITRQNIKKLITQNIDTIVLPVGSPTLLAYLDLIQSEKIAVFFPQTGAPLFRDPKLKGLIHFRATYGDEAKALVDHLVTEYGARKFAFFYQDDSYGKGPLEAAHKALVKHGIKKWTDVSYTRASINLSAQAQKLKEAQPDAIGLFSTTQQTQELIRQIGIESLTNKKLFAISPLSEESFRRFIKKSGLNILLGAVVPNPNLSDLPIIQEYRKTMDLYYYQYDVFSLEAYIVTSILLDAIDKISEPITKEKIMQQLESLNSYKFKGLNLTFNPNRRDLSPSVWIEQGQNKAWLAKKIK